jgi:cadmium resistance protein CadD (predicted permease)
MQTLIDAGLAFFVFVATDIDDLLILTVFFADARLAPRAIVGGQFAGIAVLVVVSVLAALLAIGIPAAWVALLGLVPLGMGLFSLKKLWSKADDDDEADDARQAEQRAEHKLHSQWLAVAAVTIANGGDNLGVYIPLFASRADLIVLYAAIFAVMTALWCALGHWCVGHPVAGALLRRYGEKLLPVVLTALGLLILADARVLLATG